MSDPHDDTPPAGPYAEAAHTYHRHGWAPLPLPARSKAPVPTGWTGARGAWPSYPDIHAWAEEQGGGNIALRLPPHVLGIDVDHYGGKPGGAVLHDLETRLGALPATWRTTSRDDGISGIRLYRIPEGLRWPGVLGPGIETIRTEHRYAVTWPSIHPTGSTYRWITPDGAIALGVVPTPDDLPDLPDAWVAHFTRHELSTEQARAELDGQQIGGWVQERGQGQPCRHMTTALTRAQADLHTASSRHDAALSATNRLTWLAGQGHTGAAAALQQLRAGFLSAVAGDRDPQDAAAEWERMVAGAVLIAAAAHPNTIDLDPCLDPFAGLIAKDTTPWTTASPAGPTAPAGASPRPPSAASEGIDTVATSGDSATAASPSTDTPSGSDAEPIDRTTWWPRNLEAVLTGETAEEPPNHLTRDDGHALFYAGKVNGIIGPSESGKTWVAIAAAVEAATRGSRVTILDFEDSETGVVGRLQLLGLDAGRIRDHIAYINPDEPFAPFLPSGRDLREHLEAWQPDLLILDGFNAAMTLQGLDLMSNKDATTFAQTILKPIAANGVCVIYIDHTPKNKENGTAGGIGAQAKRAMTTGCTIKVEPIKPFGKGQDGRLRAYIDKDRPGHVRGVSLPSNGTHWAADITITPTGEQLRIDVRTPEGFNADAGPASYEFRPTGYMERVSTWLAVNPGAGRNEIVTGVTGKANVVKEALRLLVEEGYVTVAKQGQKHLHTLAKAYLELTDEGPNHQPGDRGPTGVPPGSRTPVEELGSPGSHRGTKSPGPGTPVTPDDDPRPGSRPEDIVERVIAGERVIFDKRTGVIL